MVRFRSLQPMFVGATLGPSISATTMKYIGKWIIYTHYNHNKIKHNKFKFQSGFRTPDLTNTWLNWSEVLLIRSIMFWAYLLISKQLIFYVAREILLHKLDCYRHEDHVRLFEDGMMTSSNGDISALLALCAVNSPLSFWLHCSDITLFVRDRHVITLVESANMYKLSQLVCEK